MWSKQQMLDMRFDMWRHTNKYRDIVGRWTPASGEGAKMGTGQRLYLAFAIPRRPNIDELALLAGFDHEAEIRKAISVVREIDKLMDPNIDNLRGDPLDRYWSYQDSVKGYLSMLRQLLYMRPSSRR